nr:MICAL-like protein 2 isoform X1 [Paramormyrops kingsleyae]
MAAIKALQQWCKLQCDGYRDVNITNMTTSFRDGLAFCALIHKHRPDLINYDSLCKENVYDNNHLAFCVAEEQLGIPALLDAEDMVALKIPDRLSILTYVSQYYNYFHGRSPIGGLGGIKRAAEGSKEEPSGKKNQPVVAKPFASVPATENQPPSTLDISITKPQRPSPKLPRVPDQKKVLVETSNKTGTLSSTCVVCKNHVHLVQRHLVDGKLFHRSCFKCGECSSILLSGTYKVGPKPGTFVCTTHQVAKSGQKTVPSLGVALHRHDPKADTGIISSGLKNAGSHALRSTSAVPGGPINAVPAASPWTPSAARTQAARQRFFQAGLDPQPVSRVLAASDEKDRARVLVTSKLTELNRNNNNTASKVGLWKADGWSGPAPVSAPGGQGGKSSGGVTIVEPKTSNKEYQCSPYGSKGSDGSTCPSGWRANLKPLSGRPETNPAAFVKFGSPAPEKTPAGLSDTGSGRQAQPAATFPKAFGEAHASPGLKAVKGSPSLYSLKPEMESPKDQLSYISKEEIQQELKALEDGLSELERRGVELEQRLRGAEREGQDDVFDALMVDWFALISEKQSHVRKESELVYIAKTQDLEEQQPEVEVQLRRLMEKPSRLKTAADNKREEELMDKLLEIVNDRNAIIEGLDEDRLREKDEDEQLSQMMEQLGKKKIKKKQKSVVKKLFKRKQKKRAGKAC